MGWGFKIKNPIKSFSLKRLNKSFWGSGGYVLPGVFEGTMFSDKFKNTYEDIAKGLGNLVSGGYISQKEATAEMKKARDQAAQRYAAEQAAAAETARKIAEAEEERKRRLASQGSTKPQTLYGGYLGLPNTGGKSLLG